MAVSRLRERTHYVAKQSAVLTRNQRDGNGCPFLSLLYILKAMVLSITPVRPREDKSQVTVKYKQLLEGW